MSIALLRHALALIFRNFGAALRLSVIPLSMLIMLFVVSNSHSVPILPDTRPPDELAGAELGFAAIAVLAVAGLIVFGMLLSWLAVAWHRFILLGETPSIVPKVRPALITGYLLRGLWINLITVLCTIPLIALTLFTFAFMGTLGTDAQDATAINVLYGLIVGALVYFLFLRLGLGLPALAVGKELTVGESWSTTKARSATFLGIGLLLSGINLAAELVGDVLALGPISYLLYLIVFWFTVLLGISVLTTLYGHLVEGRPLTGQERAA